MSATVSSTHRPALSVFADVLRAVKHRIEDAAFRERIEEHTFAGRPLKVVIADKVAAEWYGADVARMKELDTLAGRGFAPGARVFDVGAHQGVVAMILANEVGPTGKVIAVEATERNAEIARRNVALNKIKNVEVLHAAAARVDGPILFSQKRNGAISLTTGAEVKAVDGFSIDTLMARHGEPDVVYMDIEGYEVEALKGAPQTLASKASWFIEVHGDHDIGKFGSTNADVPRMFDESFELFWSPDNFETDFKPLAHGAPVPADRFFLIAIKKR